MAIMKNEITGHLIATVISSILIFQSSIVNSLPLPDGRLSTLSIYTFRFSTSFLAKLKAFVSFPSLFFPFGTSEAVGVGGGEV